MKSCSLANTVDQNNNIILTAPSGIIESPVEQLLNEQLFYGCTWKIELPSSRSIVNLTLTHFEKNPFQNTSSCFIMSADCESQSGRCSHLSCGKYDYTDIYDGSVKGGVRLGRYCGRHHPPQRIYTTGRRMTIVLRQHDLNLGHNRRFSATYSSVIQNGKYMVNYILVIKN